MEEALNCSGARFKKDAAFGEAIHGFVWIKGLLVWKSMRCTSLLIIKKDSWRLGSSVLVMLEKMAKKTERAKLLPFKEQRKIEQQI